MNVSATGDFLKNILVRNIKNIFQPERAEVLVLRVNNERRIEQCRSKGWILKIINVLNVSIFSSPVFMSPFS